MVLILLNLYILSMEKGKHFVESNKHVQPLHCARSPLLIFYVSVLERFAAEQSSRYHQTNELMRVPYIATTTTQSS